MREREKQRKTNQICWAPFDCVKREKGIRKRDIDVGGFDRVR